MVEVSMTKMSSKGQIVIPLDMRKYIKEGEKMIVIKDGDRIVLKKVETLDKNLKEDIEFAKRTEEAWKRIEAGKGIRMDFDDFIKEMKKW